MVNLGIYCPKWVLARHNTDHKIVKTFARLKEFVDVDTSFVAAPSYTWAFNANRIIQRIIGNSNSFIRHGIRKESEIDLIYHYSKPVCPSLFFKAINHKPVVVTTGFMTDRYMFEKLGKINDRRKEADSLASNLEQASMIHFHTEGGRQRFLQYHPDFEVKTIAIPFFLPSLPLFRGTQNKRENKYERVSILFVGNEGNRKGLQELIEALDILGKEYLAYHNVEINIISKDKPNAKSGYNLKWIARLPHSDIIELMFAASIFVLVPKRESYGLVLLEAMTAGCAIVTDDEDTRKEILGDTGILLSSGTPHIVADALKRLIEDRVLRENLGTKAQKRAEDLFMPNIVATQYENCFSAVLARNK
jgi:glycosyltransferase involved in cell wall biosynthesis